MNGKTILIIEPQKYVAQAIAHSFWLDGYKNTYLSENGRRALRAAGAHKPDLIILAMGLPDINSFEVLGKLREVPGVAIFLLGEAGLKKEKQEETIVEGLALGADDYLSKPVDIRELLLRARNAMRRYDLQTAASELKVIKVGNLEIEPDNYTVRLGGKDMQLTPTEFQLLVLLAQDEGKVCARDKLRKLLSRHDSRVSYRSVDTHVSNLRRKLRQCPGQDIQTIYGGGYKLGLNMAKEQAQAKVA